MGRNHYINLNKIDEASDRNENNPIKLRQSVRTGQGEIPEVFQTQPSYYSDELNSAIGKFNLYNYKRTSATRPNYSFLYLEFNTIFDIFLLVSRENAGNDQEFKNNNSNRFNEEKEQLFLLHNRLDERQKENFNASIVENGLSFSAFSSIKMEPAPPPASPVDPPDRFKGFDAVKEGKKAEKYRRYSYGLFGLSVVTGVGSGGFALKGAISASEEVGKELTKELVKETLKKGGKEAIALGAVSATSAALGGAAKYKENQIRNEIAAYHASRASK